MRASIAIFFATAFAFYLPETGAQTSASNLEVMQTLFARVATRVDSLVTATNAEKIWLNPSAVEPPSPQRLLYTSLAQRLKREARVLLALADSSAGEEKEGIVVKNSIATLAVSYRKLKRSSWFRRALTERTINVAVDFDLREARTQRIHFQGMLTAVQVDTLSGKVNQWENPRLPFTLGAWQQTEKSTSWLEPALLTAATGAIVYAFYSLRSQ